MGGRRRGMAVKTWVMLLVLAAYATAAPVDDSAAIDDQIQTNAKFNEAAANTIHKAEGSLLAMKKVQKAEIAEMKAIGADVRAEKASDGPIQAKVFKDAKEEANEAIKGEYTQQNDAVKALHTISHVVKAFKAAGVTKLGETQDPKHQYLDQQKAAAAQAVKNLKKVEASLKSETKTSHTREKIQKVFQEASELEHWAIMGEKPQLGDTVLDSAPEHGGAGSLLRKNLPSAKALPPAIAKGMLKQEKSVQQGLKNAKPVPAGDRNKALEKRMIAQEKSIQEAEHRNEHELDRLAGLLH